MIKAKLKNGVCRIKSGVDGRNMLDECAHLMIRIAKLIKKDNIPMDDFLYSIAKYAASIYGKNNKEE